MTCSQANALRTDVWIRGWSQHPNHDTFRSQIEKAAIILKRAKPGWTSFPEVSEIREMTNEQLDTLGEGVKMQYLGQNNILIQFGFNGNKYIEVIFERSSSNLSTRIYYFNGFCFIIKDFGSQYTSHLPPVGTYSEW